MRTVDELAGYSNLNASQANANKPWLRVLGSHANRHTKADSACDGVFVGSYGFARGFTRPTCTSTRHARLSLSGRYRSAPIFKERLIIGIGPPVSPVERGLAGTVDFRLSPHGRRFEASTASVGLGPVGRSVTGAACVLELGFFSHELARLAGLPRPHPYTPLRGRTIQNL